MSELWWKYLNIAGCSKPATCSVIRRNIENADLVVVNFGEKYKQWNAAFDAGYSAAKGKSLIIMHDDDNQHALKEIDATALAVVQNNQQLIEILKYVTKE